MHEGMITADSLTEDRQQRTTTTAFAVSTVCARLRARRCRVCVVAAQWLRSCADPALFEPWLCRTGQIFAAWEEVVGRHFRARVTRCHGHR